MGNTLILKLFLVPLLIWGVTLAGRKWGPTVAGWLSAFPIVAGPILLIISLERGSVFAAHAAQGTLLAVLAMMVFSLAYAWASGRFGVFGSMCCGLSGWGLAVMALQGLQVPPWLAYVLVIATLLWVPRLFPVISDVPLPATRPNDLPWRMLAAALLVLGVTFFADRLGARLAGFLAMFPVMGTVLTGFSHRYCSRAFAVALLRGTVLGFFAFATFCLIISTQLEKLGIASGFVLAFGVALAVQLGVKKWAT